MFWEYSRKDTKLLLIATLLLFSACAIEIGHIVGIETRTGSLPANTVGVYAGVEENRTNSLVAQLDAREEELNAREEALLIAEHRQEERYPSVIIIIGLGLFGLILLNFYLDHKRRLSLPQ